MSKLALPRFSKLPKLPQLPRLPRLPIIDPVIRTFVMILVMTFFAALIALPKESSFVIPLKPNPRTIKITRPDLNVKLLGQTIQRSFELKQGLDIQGGTQVVLKAEMKDIPAESRTQALDAAKAVIQRRVDLYGVSEPVVQTSQTNGEYRIVVELAGVKDTDQALSLIGQTALLDFRIHKPTSASPSAQVSPLAFLSEFQQTGLDGKMLKKASVQFDPKTNEPVVSIEFDKDGTTLFGKITSQYTGEMLGIFLDGYPMMLPKINQPILTGQAVITGQFTVEEAKQLAIQLNAGALPVPISVLEQRTIGASLGQEAVAQTFKAGLVGIGLVMLFMTLYYGWRGVISSFSLLIYAVLTIAVYKLIGVTLTLPGIAGLLLSIGMAVDSNILIFERMKEELRAGRSFGQALELGFGRAWDSIKDANVATICTALILINPLDFTFLNTSGLVRGFGVTLLIGVVISLFTGMVVTRTFMKLFLSEPKEKK